MIVLDASAIFEWLLRTPVGLTIQQRALPALNQIYVPHLIYIEAIQALRRAVRSQTISAPRGQVAVQDLLDFPLNVYEHYPFLRRVWSLRSNVSAYDAVYIALAESLAAPLITCDSKLASTPGHSAAIELFATP